MEAGCGGGIGRIVASGLAVGQRVNTEGRGVPLREGTWVVSWSIPLGGEGRGTNPELGPIGTGWA